MENNIKLSKYTIKMLEELKDYINQDIPFELDIDEIINLSLRHYRETILNK